MYKVLLREQVLSMHPNIRKLSYKCQLFLVFVQEDSGGEFISNFIQESERTTDVIKFLREAKRLNEEFAIRQVEIEKKKRKGLTQE